MSEVKVNKISPRTACGTVTLGDSGDTFTIPSGATITNAGTASGFGATGAVNWDTASIKTATFTSVSGNGYFCNTTGGAFDIVLPASPSAGDIVGLKDYAGTFSTNNLTIDRNGSKLDGSEVNRPLSTIQTSLTMVYVDSTQGWKSVEEGTGSVGENFIVATGGTPCTGAIVCTDYKTHTFTAPGTFCVSSIATTAANNAVAYMVVAGGGGSGSSSYVGGGGAGGYREGTTSPIVPYTASPIVAATGLTVSASSYAITVGAGGAGGTAPVDNNRGRTGSDSIFSTITSAGGGGGGAYNPTPTISNRCGFDGGSGGGGAANAGPAGAGNTPPVSPSQGFTGGVGTGSSGGGGGGATAVGATGGPSAAPPGGGNDGGAGATTNITASPVTYSTGGRGLGGSGPSCVACANTGDGGGQDAGAGGSGIVVIRYKFQ